MTDKIEFFTSKILHIHRIKYKIKKSWKIERGNCYVQRGRGRGNLSYFCRSNLNGFAGSSPPTVCYG